MTYSFYQAVYQVTAQIPAGRVATYGQIAFLAGRPRYPADAAGGGGRPLPPRRPGGPVPVPVGRGYVLLPALRTDG